MAANDAVVDKGGGFNSNDAYIAQLLMAAYAQRSANQAAKPKQQQLTPAQQHIQDLFIASLDDPAFKGNAHLVNGIARGVVSQGPPQWNSPKTSTGETGYTMPQMDWSKYIASIPGAGAGSGAPPPPPSATVGGTNSANTGVSGVTAPAGSAGDPFSSLPETRASGSTNGIPRSLTEIASRYGKPAAELVSAIMSMNPLMGLKGAWDAYQAWKSGKNDIPALPQTNRFNGINLAPAGGAPRDTSQSGSTWDISYRDTNTTPGYGTLGPGGGSQLGGGGMPVPGGGGGWLDESTPGGGGPGRRRNLT